MRVTALATLAILATLLGAASTDSNEFVTLNTYLSDDFHNNVLDALWLMLRGPNREIAVMHDAAPHFLGFRDDEAPDKWLSRAEAFTSKNGIVDGNGCYNSSSCVAIKLVEAMGLIAAGKGAVKPLPAMVDPYCAPTLAQGAKVKEEFEATFRVPYEAHVDLCGLTRQGSYTKRQDGLLPDEEAHLRARAASQSPDSQYCSLASVGFVVAGSLRNFENSEEQRKSFRYRVLDGLGGDIECDEKVRRGLFMHLDVPAASAVAAMEAIAELSPTQVTFNHDDRVRVESEGDPRGMWRVRAQFAKLHRAFALLTQFEQDRGFKFDFVARVRLDIWPWSLLPAAHLFPATHVYVSHPTPQVLVSEEQPTPMRWGNWGPLEDFSWLAPRSLADPLFGPWSTDDERDSRTYFDQEAYAEAMFWRRFVRSSTPWRLYPLQTPGFTFLIDFLHYTGYLNRDGFLSLLQSSNFLTRYGVAFTKGQKDHVHAVLASSLRLRLRSSLRSESSGNSKATEREGFMQYVSTSAIRDGVGAWTPAIVYRAGKLGAESARAVAAGAADLIENLWLAGEAHQGIIALNEAGDMLSTAMCNPRGEAAGICKHLEMCDLADTWTGSGVRPFEPCNFVASGNRSLMDIYLPGTGLG